MAAKRSGAIERDLGTLLEQGAVGALTDGQLLARFVDRRDSATAEAAFAALVERHGPVVLRVCRLLTGDAHEAQDAFQATFLVLARRAGSIRRPELLGNWLYGVAHRTARKARARLSRLRRLEVREGASMGVAGLAFENGPLPREEIRAVHEELDRLADKYRAPVVLCYLEGCTHEEAARRLQWPVGTVRGRLSRARDQLRARLGRRGVTLSAGLLAAALSAEATASPVPGALALATVDAAMFVVGAGAITSGSATTLTLSRQVFGSLIMTKFTVAGVVIAAVALSGLVLGRGEARGGKALGLASAPDSEHPPKPPGDRKPDLPKLEVGVDLEMIQVAGRVAALDGRAIAGATITHATESKEGRAPIATSGADGLFRGWILRPALGQASKVVATAEGFGLDWAEVGSGETTLRLPEGGPIVEGRVVGLEGSPVVGASVHLVRVGKLGEGRDLTPWLEHNVAERRRGHYINDEGLATIDGKVLPTPPDANTDADGRFRLAGFGRGRVLHLLINGASIESTRIWVATVTDPIAGAPVGEFGIYPARFDHVVGPAKPIVGTIRDRRTGKPLSGINLRDGRGQAMATTDAEGRYRLQGAPKQKQYFVAAGGDKGRPYFDLSKFNVSDTPGLTPLTVDFELERGVEVNGRLLDGATGQPVAGRIYYYPWPDNPHLQDYVTLGGPKMIVSHWGRVAADGSFTILAIPGPGALVACATDQERYARLDGRQRLFEMGLRSWPSSDAIQAIVRIDPDEANPRSLVRDIALKPARRLSGTIEGPDGSPLAGVHAAGLKSFEIHVGPYRSGSPSQPLEGTSFTAVGLDPDRSHDLVFYQPEKQLGVVMRVKGDDPGPVKARLAPLGGFEGRVLDRGGKPWPGLTVVVGLNESLDVRRPEELPWTEITEHGYSSLLRRTTKTDAEGRFHVEGILPGLPFEIQAGPGDEPLRNQLYSRDGLSAESGRTTPLGDLKANGARPAGGD